MVEPNQDVVALLTQLDHLAKDPPENENLRYRLYVAARNLSLAVETPMNTVKRISFSALDLIVSKIACNLGICEALSNHDHAMSIQDLVTVTKVDASLLTRVLRYMAAASMISELPGPTYGATKTTHTLSDPGFRAGLEHHFDAQLPSWLALPAFLDCTFYIDPSDSSNTAFQVAHCTDLPAFEWAATQPKMMRDFAMWMSAQRAGQNNWLDAFPADCFKDDNANIESPIFVDVGGGVGHQCLALKARFPEMKRGIILQDLPQVLERAVSVEGVTHMPYSFWEEEPVKGASYYYLRNILHNYPDEACITILRNVKTAMSSHSAILIDEKVLPRVGVPLQIAQLDVAMMASLAGRERNEEDWRTVVSAADLEIQEIIAYQEQTKDKVIVIVLP